MIGFPTSLLYPSKVTELEIKKNCKDENSYGTLPVQYGFPIKCLKLRYNKVSNLAVFRVFLYKQTTNEAYELTMFFPNWPQCAD